MVFAGEERLGCEHLSENTSRAPDVHLHVIFLPGEHNFRCSVVSRRHITSHLRVLNSGQAKVANLEIAVFIDQDVAWFEIAVDNSSRMDVFETTLEEWSGRLCVTLIDSTYEYLVKKVLDELFLKRT